MRRFALLLALVLALGGCSAQTGTGGGGSDGAHLVPSGKADNYYSDVAHEFEVEGTIPVAMTAEEYADEAKRGEAVTRRLTAVGLYLTAYVTDKFRGIDSNGDGMISDSEVFFRNEGYGGFHAMVRNYSLETLEVAEGGEAGYQAKFTIDLAGPPDLLRLIPKVEDVEQPADGLVFDFRMPKDATSNPESVARGEIRNFNPDNYTGELETVRLTARKLPEPRNAYPHFADFVADGLYDITLFYGHDYNTSRSDLREAREAFEELEHLGFEAPAASFEELDADSGPFTKEARAGGQPIRLEVRIFHSDMFTTDRQRQHDLALSEITARDVFFYNGHAGPYFGFYLDEARTATVNYWEFAEAPFAEDRQQLVVAQGCQTYSQYADMLYASPAKDEGNLDVITTVNYSYGQGTIELLRNLVKFDRDGNHQPVDFYEIVKDLNADWLNEWKAVFYGVMGIDGNPELHPYANVGAIGDACSSNGDCGDPSANVCMEANGDKTCAARALRAEACPEGTRFGLLGVGDTIEGGVCHRQPD